MLFVYTQLQPFSYTMYNFFFRAKSLKSLTFLKWLRVIFYLGKSSNWNFAFYLAMFADLAEFQEKVFSLTLLFITLFCIYNAHGFRRTLAVNLNKKEIFFDKEAID